MSEYEKGRPTYPSSATKLLDRIFTKNLGASTVVDLGAGTGKWTSTLVNYFQGPNTTAAKFQVHAVEPVVNFREVLRSKFSSCNEVVVHDGSAKDLTRLFRPGSINAISVATAFHWFATEEVLQQFCDVLKPQGWVYLIWNVQVYDLEPELRHHYPEIDERNEQFLRALKRKVVNTYHDETSPEMGKNNYRAMKGDILKLVNDFGLFGSGNEYQCFHNSMQQLGDVDVVINHVLSISSFGRRSEEEKELVRQEIRDLVLEWFESLDYDRIFLPYRTDVLLLQKLGE